MGGNGTRSMSGAIMSELEFSRLAKDFTYDSAGFRHALSDPDLFDVDTADTIRRFDAALDQGSFNGELFRGVRLSDSAVSKMSVGDVIDQKGMSSWSLSGDEAERFALNARRDYGDGLAVVFVMDGTSHGRNITQYSSHQGELEVAVSSMSRQRITRIERPENGPWGVVRVYVREA